MNSAVNLLDRDGRRSHARRPDTLVETVEGVWELEKRRPVRCLDGLSQAAVEPPALQLALPFALPQSCSHWAARTCKSSRKFATFVLLKSSLSPFFSSMRGHTCFSAFYPWISARRSTTIRQFSTPRENELWRCSRTRGSAAEQPQRASQYRARTPRASERSSPPDIRSEEAESEERTEWGVAVGRNARRQSTSMENVIEDRYHLAREDEK